jgi:sulfate/thiosulfate transport system ATP-binding protein
VGIALENVSKYFNNFRAVDRVNLEIAAGSLVSLLGPSGSGKSTLLRLISGLEKLDRGRIWLEGVDVSPQSIQARNIGFVFQHHALFKHLTIRQNIGFGLEIRSTPTAKINTKVEELLDLIQLTNLADRYPVQLSGGQQQRVALARALAIEPKVLLLDEPFGALDARVRKDLRSWLRRLHDRSHVTTILVTHDQSEAIQIADSIIIMNAGRIEQVGTPAAIYDRPATPFVTSFMSRAEILPSSANIFQQQGIAAAEPQVLEPAPDLVTKQYFYTKI